VWLVGIGLVLAGAFAGGYAVRSSQQRRANAAEQVIRDQHDARIEADREALRHALVGAEGEVAAARSRIAGAEARAEESSQAARRLRATLAGTLSAPDSIPVLVSLVAAQDRQIAAQDTAIFSYREALLKEAEAGVILRARIATDSTALAWLQSRPVVAPIPARRSPLRVAETGAIALATVGACSQGVTVGCVAGAVVTLARVW
jgi:hypothetical protein